MRLRDAAVSTVRHAIGPRGNVLTALAAVFLSLFSVPRARAQGTSGHVTRQPPVAATTVPIELRRGGVVVVLAEVDGHRGYYALDTGSPEIVLNEKYLRMGSGGLDTVLANPASGSSTIHPSDTVATQPTQSDAINPDSLARRRWHRNMDFHDHNTGDAICTTDSVTVRIGTQTIAVMPNNAATTTSGLPFMAVLTSLAVQEEYFGQILGILGPSVFDGYETIIDYDHRQLTLIPLDSTGRRRVPVARYTPSTMIPMEFEIGHLPFHWYAVGTVGGRVDTLELDTGNDRNELNATTATLIPTHITRTGRFGHIDGHDEPEGILDRFELGGQTFTDLPFNLSPADGREDTLGGAFFRRVGVVGFNFQTRQLLFYEK